MHSDEATQLFSKMFSQVGSRWTLFINHIKKIADKDDESQVFYEDFVNVLRKFKI